MKRITHTLALVAVAVAVSLHQGAQPASAANAYDPRGHRRCTFGEIQADPARKTCRLATWTEARNGGGTVRFTAFVRKLRAGERQS